MSKKKPPQPESFPESHDSESVAPSVEETIDDKATEISDVVENNSAATAAENLENIDFENSDLKNDEDDEQKSSASASENKTQKEKKPSRIGSVIFGFIVLALIGGLGYLQWMDEQRYREQANAISDIAVEKAGQDQTAQTISSDISRLENLVADQQTALRELQSENESLMTQVRSQINAQKEQLLAFSSISNDDWKLAEAHYLTRLANQRIKMERNGAGALALLEAADEIIKNRNDPDLFVVREKLQEDITALKLTSDIDREGIYLRLSALSKALDNLPNAVPLNYQQQNIAADSTAEEEPQSGWAVVKRSFKQAVGKLESFVRITNHEEPLQPLLPLEGQAYLQTSLRLALETAQLALIREQQTIYETSLENALRLLDAWYPLSSTAAGLSEEIASLRTLSIKQDLPDISNAEKILGQYLEMRHRLNGTNRVTPQDRVENTAPNNTNEAEGQ